MCLYSCICVGCQSLRKPQSSHCNVFCGIHRRLHRGRGASGNRLYISLPFRIPLYSLASSLSFIRHCVYFCIPFLILYSPHLLYPSTFTVLSTSIVSLSFHCTLLVYFLSLIINSTNPSTLCFLYPTRIYWSLPSSFHITCLS